MLLDIPPVVISGPVIVTWDRERIRPVANIPLAILLSHVQSDAPMFAHVFLVGLGAASIAHNVIIGAKCILTSGIIIGGSAKIGDNCFIGIGSVIRDHIKICSGVRIGMGSVITKDITIPGIYFNNIRKGDWDGTWWTK